MSRLGTWFVLKTELTRLRDEYEKTAYEAGGCGCCYTSEGIWEEAKADAFDEALRLMGEMEEQDELLSAAVDWLESLENSKESYD